jgi:hypothetical protein
MKGSLIPERGKRDLFDCRFVEKKGRKHDGF